MPTKPSTKASSRSVTLPLGFSAAGITSGVKASGKPDLALILSDRPCAAAGVFTKNKLPGAPVLLGKRHLKDGVARAVLCNSGIANDATGQQGIDNALRCCELLAIELIANDVVNALHPSDIIPSSTGVIGPQLRMDKMEPGIADIATKLKRSKRADLDAATAIMTTDLVPKQASKKLTLSGGEVAIGGIAKGSGMIAPNMATMLVFITTDVAIEPGDIKAMLTEATAASFNRISVDQHTSPSDTVLLLANGASGVSLKNDADRAAFIEALTELCQHLAYQIVQDGEGATKVFRVRVLNAKTERDADRVGKAVVDSPLVKTAVHGSDPNWGRIVTAAGYSGATMKPERLSLHVGPSQAVCVFDRGEPVALSAAKQKRLDTLMTKKEVVFTLDLGYEGGAAVDWLGCDLSREYIRINADYTT